MSTPVFRFAPSPNGYLHLGHACSALVNARMAAAAGGRMLLRIEDIDLTRRRDEIEQAIYEDLAWIGIEWETPVRRQSDHLDDYRAALDALRDEGLVYPAFMSRGDISGFVADHEADGQAWPRDPDGVPLYPGLDRQLSQRERARRIADGAPYTWRLDMQAAASRLSAPVTWSESGAGPDGATGIIRSDPRAWGDVVLARADVPASYHIAVVVDDALQGVTHVVRGRDLFGATAVHRLLQELLGLSVPDYHHHHLVLDEDGRKLSKSRASTSLRALRESGMQPSDIVRLTGLDAAHM